MTKYLVAFLLFVANVLPLNGQQVYSISKKGKSLRAFFLDLNVEKKWAPGHQVNWETGEADRRPDAKHKVKTHCSSFVAAACKKKGVYILRPPAHSQLLLANAQFEWLGSDTARSIGWRKITSKETFPRYFSAQEYANSGYLVVAVWKNDDPRRPGHIAFIMPTEITDETIVDQGPLCISAGRENSSNVPLVECFSNHINQWPEPSIEFFYFDEPK